MKTISQVITISAASAAKAAKLQCHQIVFCWGEDTIKKESNETKSTITEL